jgi:hypothetical protein
MLPFNEKALMANGSTDGRARAVQNALINQKLISSSDYSRSGDSSSAKPYDMHGYPLVPLIESMVESDASAEEWQEVAAADTQTFTAFSGPPIWQNFSQHEFNPTMDYGGIEYVNYYRFLGSLQLASEYFFVQCSLPEMRPLSAFPNGTLEGLGLSLNFTNNDRAPNTAGVPTKPKEFELWARWNSTASSQSSYKSDHLTGSIVSTCNLTATVVDVDVTCVPDGCIAKKVRKSPDHPLRNPATPFDDGPFSERFFENLLTSMGPPTPFADDPYSNTMGVAYLIGLSSTIFNFETRESNPEGFEANTENNFLASVYSLSQVINTLYMASQAASGDCGRDINGDYMANCNHFTAKGSIYNPQYLISYPWIVMDFISCFILLGAAIFAYWLRTRTLAPDIFGYVSSFTRENPHFNLPTENWSTLSGVERAKLLGGVKIKIGEHTQDDGVARVVVSHVVDGYEAKALKKEGKYA